MNQYRRAMLAYRLGKAGRGAWLWALVYLGLLVAVGIIWVVLSGLQLVWHAL